MNTPERLKIGSDEIAIHVSSGTLLATEVTIPAGGGPPRCTATRPRSSTASSRASSRSTSTDRRIVAGPGSVTHIPGGTPHNVRNESDAPAHAYVVFSPGTEFEAFVRAVAADPENVIFHAMANGIEFT